MSQQSFKKFEFQLESFSEIGQKINNEDALLVCKSSIYKNVFLVCDGLGGHPAGEIAAQLTCETLKKYFSLSDDKAISSVEIIESLESAKKAIGNHEVDHPETLGMKTTMAALITDAFGLKIVWLGDSRVYHLRDGKILFQTLDHSYLNYLLYQKGADREEAMIHPKRHKITRVIGSERDAEPEIHEVMDVAEGDYFLICSDGLLEQIDDVFLQEKCKKEANIQELGINIYDACKNKTKDNYSMILIKVIRNK